MHEVNELVCVRGAAAFVMGGQAYPCGSRWVSARTAADLLGVAPHRLWAAIAGEGVPTDWRGWVSLDWVHGILEARDRRDA